MDVRLKWVLRSITTSLQPAGSESERILEARHPPYADPRTTMVLVGVLLLDIFARATKVAERRGGSGPRYAQGRVG